MTTKEILIQAKALISDKDHWTQRFFARNKERMPVSPAGKSACQWCAIGAIIRIRYNSKLEYLREAQAYNALTQSIKDLNLDLGVSKDWDLIGAFNDHADTTHEDIIKIFDKAIQLAEGESQ